MVHRTTVLGLVKHVTIAVLAVAVFFFCWFLRFNDPGGAFAGLTDDHFFYLVRGWQILFGELPVRDFVDHGAPLFYYLGAAIQLVDRGTLSELLFTTTAIALGCAITFVLAQRGSGSILAALLAVAFQVLLEPRFYNYPKLLVYAAAIPLLWWYADAPSVRRILAVAVVTVIGFLFRHDHGIFVAIATATLLVTMSGVPWGQRCRDACAYGGACLLLLAPYLLFIQYNGGLGLYWRQASAWAARDRDRAPVIWPSPIESWEAALYYVEIAIPLVAIAFLLNSPDAFRKGWKQARAKLAMVAVLALVLDAGFLRSPLAARLADPTVPLCILLAWMMVASLRMWGSGGKAVAVAATAVTLLLVGVCGAAVGRDIPRTLERTGFTSDMGPAAWAEDVAADVRRSWEVESWADLDPRSEVYDLSLYVNRCTAPEDRILVQDYMPQMLALARRGFAGGHADLRPGFFDTDEAVELTISRLRRQSVPMMILLGRDDSIVSYEDGFPLLAAYIRVRYRIVGHRMFDNFPVVLLVEKDRPVVSTYQPLGWPCFRAS